MAVSDQPTIDLSEPGGWRRGKNQIATGLMYFAFVVILVPLGLVLYEVIAKGAKAISWQFLSNSTVPPNVMPLGQGGMGAAVVGTLEITGVETEREHDGDIVVFDPMRVTDGIEASDDPVLRFRTLAYSASVKLRTGVDRGPEAPAT